MCSSDLSAWRQATLVVLSLCSFSLPPVFLLGTTLFPSLSISFLLPSLPSLPPCFLPPPPPSLSLPSFPPSLFPSLSPLLLLLLFSPSLVFFSPEAWLSVYLLILSLLLIKSSAASPLCLPVCLSTVISSHTHTSSCTHTHTHTNTLTQHEFGEL